jgi:hypothetical protein
MKTRYFLLTVGYSGFLPTSLSREIPKRLSWLPNSMVLTQSVAERYFGKNKDAVGKSLKNDKGDVYKITAYCKRCAQALALYFQCVDLSQQP